MCRAQTKHPPSPHMRTQRPHPAFFLRFHLGSTCVADCGRVKTVPGYLDHQGCEASCWCMLSYQAKETSNQLYLQGIGNRGNRSQGVHTGHGQQGPYSGALGEAGGVPWSPSMPGTVPAALGPGGAGAPEQPAGVGTDAGSGVGTGAPTREGPGAADAALSFAMKLGLIPLIAPCPYE